MKCDICGKEIRSWQDRHSSGNTTAHSSCEIGEPPLDDPATPKPKSFKLRWVGSIHWGKSKWEEYP